ncbi:glutamine cyclotransferase [Xenorhabdus cabanillasii]|uniref:Glutamine cyclotransferase n=1 Tax=Xenorhabdus cabanillasii TaxID=351673 RepID=A0A3D9UAA1_9GAMM|nr:glutaminyl-peptide cyclotransferase [Xenorhabdus cabanillasii]REF26402.1 glutamine cyclotransferase [Xenorhabdus cabanillasii]
MSKYKYFLKNCNVIMAISIFMIFTASYSCAIPEKNGYKIIRKIPHNQESFTQGLISDGNNIIESTGFYNKSKINVIDSANGTLLKSKELPKDVWGEGLTKLNGRYYVLTWKENKLLVLDTDNFHIIESINYEGEGWGLTTDGKNLIMSNGSAELFYRNPSDFSVEKSIQVTYNSKKIEKINELEWIKGLIYANVWYTDIILVIDPTNGKVIKWIDLAGIQFSLDIFDKNTNTLNGIAYDPISDKIYVTGKNWSNIFEVKFTGNDPYK